MKKAKKEIIIPEYFITKLSNYSILTTNERGDLIENISKQALNRLGYSYNSLGNKDIQYYLGDILILSKKDKRAVLADIKASHTWFGVDKVALDYKYYQKGTEEDYIPSNSNDNKGYIYHLNADSLICVNPNSKKLYIVNKFRRLRDKVLELIDDRGCTTSSLLEISTNRFDQFKDTKIINIAFEDMKQLGAEVIQYNLDKQQVNDIIISEKQKDLSVGSTQV